MRDALISDRAVDRKQERYSMTSTSADSLGLASAAAMIAVFAVASCPWRPCGDPTGSDGRTTWAATVREGVNSSVPRRPLLD